LSIYLYQEGSRKCRCYDCIFSSQSLMTYQQQPHQTECICKDTCFPVPFLLARKRCQDRDGKIDRVHELIVCKTKTLFRIINSFSSKTSKAKLCLSLRIDSLCSCQLIVHQIQLSNFKDALSRRANRATKGRFENRDVPPLEIPYHLQLIKKASLKQRRSNSRLYSDPSSQEDSDRETTRRRRRRRMNGRCGNRVPIEPLSWSRCKKWNHHGHAYVRVHSRIGLDSSGIATTLHPDDTISVQLVGSTISASSLATTAQW
jgi:hypothetical protein